MSGKKWFSLLVLIFAGLLLDARVARACSCGAQPTVLDAYEHAKVVVIVKVVSVEKAEEGSEKSYLPGGIISATVVVEKVFKGDLKVGDEMIFGQGGGADCIWTFDEKDIGQQFLFYPGQVRKNPSVWMAGTCGRGGNLRYVAEDLLYLNNLDKLRGKTRISGVVGFDRGAGQSVEGLKIRIIGAKKTYEVKTDENGVYEIYDLPAGKYLVEPQMPFGWKLDVFWLSYSPSFAGDKMEEAPTKIPIVLEEKKHASLDIHFEIDNTIRGRVYDPDGKPMKNVCVKAIATEGESGFHLDCTDEGGNFSIKEIPRGSYVLAVNEDGKINSREPFGLFYYPNVLEREKAAIITMLEGEFREDINIYVPKVEETITVEGVFLYADGKPVVEEVVQFKAGKVKDNVEGDAREMTDAQGRFSMKILKGLKGQLHGEMFTYVGEFENCPKLEAVIKKTGRDSADLKTPALEIQADKDIYNVELKYPFPGCKKAR